MPAAPVTDADGSTVTAAPGTTTPTTTPATFPPAEPDAKNFLITGADNNACVDPDSPYAPAFGDRSNFGERSDTIMMWRVNPSTSQVAVLSFPRDLFVDIAGSSRTGRINEAYERDNPQKLIDTIYQNFGIVTDHFVQVDFCAFQELVKAVDGVAVPLPYPVRDPNTGLNVPEAGCFTFTGDHALAYVRSRKLEYLDGDRRVEARRHLGPRAHLAPAGLPEAHGVAPAGQGGVQPRRGGRSHPDPVGVHRHRSRSHTRQDAGVRRRAQRRRPDGDHDLSDRGDAEDDPGQRRAGAEHRWQQHAGDPVGVPGRGDARRDPRSGLRDHHPTEHRRSAADRQRSGTVGTEVAPPTATTLPQVLADENIFGIVPDKNISC